MKIIKFFIFLILFGSVGCSNQVEFDDKAFESVSEELLDCEKEIGCEEPPITPPIVIVREEVIIRDSFERQDVIVNRPGLPGFGWRKIVDDGGNITGGPGQNIDALIFNNVEMGPVSHLTRALYFFGRRGRSIHNIYLVSRTFDLSVFDEVFFNFDYLPISLEVGEYLKLEVCNNTADACGVGSELTAEGLNGPHWMSIYDIQGPLAPNRNGKNHRKDAWKTAETQFFLEDFNRSEFVFRMNTRMDEGFINNNRPGRMEDGVAIDFVEGIAVRYKEVPE